MTELRIKFHLTEWFIKPEIVKNNRTIKISFLFFTINILKKQKR